MKRREFLKACTATIVGAGVASETVLDDSEDVETKFCTLWDPWDPDTDGYLLEHVDPRPFGIDYWLIRPRKD